MGYKRFSIGIPALSGDTQNLCDSVFVSTVSSVEIGNNNALHDKALEKKRSKHHTSSFALRLIAASAAFALLLSFIPLPEQLENFLLMTAKSLSVSEFVSENIAEETITEANTIPANTPKSISEISNNTQNSQQSASIQSINDFSQSPYSKISNETKYGVDIEAVLTEKYPIDALTTTSASNDDAITVFSDSLPEVLIIHTHGTECYIDAESENFRTNDTNKNVVKVGRAFYERLRKNGVSAIHLENMFDKTSYINAYSNSYAAVSEQLRQYPSIKYVIDIHRDAVCDTSGVYEPMLFDENTARMMFVIGTDEAGSGHTGWQKNLRTALGLQYAVSSQYPGLMRNLNLRRASFNQQLCDGYFILEVGNCGNTLEQAVNAAEIFADVFSNTV